MSYWHEFLQTRTVKELNSIRRKGVMMEDIMAEVIEFMGVRCVDRYDPPGAAFMYHETFWANADGDKMVWAEARVGMPTLAVSFKTKEKYLALRKHLIGKGLVR